MSWLPSYLCGCFLLLSWPGVLGESCLRKTHVLSRCLSDNDVAFTDLFKIVNLFDTDAKDFDKQCKAIGKFKDACQCLDRVTKQCTGISMNFLQLYSVWEAACTDRMVHRDCLMDAAASRWGIGYCFVKNMLKGGFKQLFNLSKLACRASHVTMECLLEDIDDCDEYTHDILVRKGILQLTDDICKDGRGVLSFLSTMLSNL
ncbi:uncharacterized protein LOC101852392 [Aplysia californica]|uniref:Uncharacterized protein LOC101852392 n=1 Tax=Aplysia californica TaxID=6500 RepID=A0ABM0ZVK2_APLCA|nr:uncharacterized protein LOC101852392 [Aplysia californica]